ncbi:hypothetical protein OE88DRAFT_1667874 [Heliocybe sulcata]|uniref:Uncharacterized protein n=1 Tax=Heliocybe sulcata TaxID=5364 RepID=A0A5C3MLQ3_9AGAM|nr:hypothetical protein OE88DRAFT_1667874 [Heliocybe sulcata]
MKIPSVLLRRLARPQQCPPRHAALPDFEIENAYANSISMLDMTLAIEGNRMPARAYTYGESFFSYDLFSTFLSLSPSSPWSSDMVHPFWCVWTFLSTVGGRTRERCAGCERTLSSLSYDPFSILVPAAPAVSSGLPVLGLDFLHKLTDYPFLKA